jgi:hypothetical protein
MLKHLKKTDSANLCGLTDAANSLQLLAELDRRPALGRSTGSETYACTRPGMISFTRRKNRFI